MKLDDLVILEWKYSPENFFEARFEINRDGYMIYIGDGRVTANIRPEMYDKEHLKREQLHTIVDGYFRAIQVVTHKQYRLPMPSMYRQYPDGRRDATVFVESCAIKIGLGCPDILITNAQGDVICDTKRDRVERQRVIGHKIEKFNHDTLLQQLLKSYQSAVEDPSDEMLHLYEIRDSLSKHFGNSDKKTKSVLKIPDRTWSRFGQLTCKEPLLQGRHRGEHYDALRPATQSELEEARGIALGFIEAYLDYLSLNN